MELSEMLKEIKSKKAEASVDVSQLKPGVQSTAEGLRRAAEERLYQLIDQYKTEVVNGSSLVTVVGAGSVRYAEMAARAGYLTVDYQTVVTKISGAIAKRSSSVLFSNQEWWMFLDELNFLKRTYNIMNIPPPLVNRATDPVFDNPVPQAVKFLIKNNYGESLNSAVARRMIGEEAFERGVDTEHLFVVLYNCVEVDTTFLPKPISSIDVEGEIEEKEVMEHLSKIKQMVAPRKKPGRKPKNNKETSDE